MKMGKKCEENKLTAFFTSFLNRRQVNCGAHDRVISSRHILWL